MSQRGERAGNRIVESVGEIMLRGGSWRYGFRVGFGLGSSGFRLGFAFFCDFRLGFAFEGYTRVVFTRVCKLLKLQGLRNGHF